MSSADQPERLTDDEVESRWREYCARAPELMPLFRDLSLGVCELSVAESLRLRNRHELRDWMKKRGLPPLRIFRNWYYLVTMVERFGGEEALSAWAMKHGYYASVYSRFVSDLAGKHWREVLKSPAVDVKRHALDVFRVHTEW